MVINVSDRKEAEQKLKESEKKYREAYDKANFYKELIAHDMNNILQTIQSSVELYNLFQKSPENVKYRKEVFDIISSSVFRGSSLVSNIIKLSEIEETKFPTKIIEAKRILDNSIEHINRSYQGLKLNIKVETDLIKIYLKANELLSDLFENLLVNAVKHNENPEIEIQIKISEEISNETKYAKFEFLDNGIGILDEIKQELFEKSIDRKSSKKGLGIGLSLVRQIVKSYNGKIWVENRVEGDHEKGSNFIVLIPAAD
jgi:signal transduction histidine kinase